MKTVASPTMAPFNVELENKLFKDAKKVEGKSIVKNLLNVMDIFPLGDTNHAMEWYTGKFCILFPDENSITIPDNEEVKTFFETKIKKELPESHRTHYLNMLKILMLLRKNYKHKENAQIDCLEISCCYLILLNNPKADPDGVKDKVQKLIRSKYAKKKIEDPHRFAKLKVDVGKLVENPKADVTPKIKL